MRSYRNYIRDGEHGVIPRSTLRQWIQTGRLTMDDTQDHEMLHQETNGANSMDCENISISDEQQSDLEDKSDSERNSNSEDDMEDFRAVANDKNKLSWLRQPLYVNSIANLGESVELILKFYHENSISKRCLGSLLDLLSTLLPTPNNLPRTKYQLYQRLDTLIPNESTSLIKKHRFCEDCTTYVGDWSNKVMTCTSCKGIKTTGMFVEYDLRSLLVHAFEVRNLHKLIDEHAATANNDPNFVTDLTCGSEFKRLKQEVITENYDICLLWNTDGIQVARSSTAQLWPVQVQIVNIPPKNRRNFQFTCGLYYGTAKPNMLSFLQPFVSAVKDIYTTGLQWRHPVDNTIIYSTVIAPISTLDCPARAAVQNIKQFNGEYGCSYCEHPGETYRTRNGFKHIYAVLEEKPPVRTHEGMLQQALAACDRNISHVKGVKGPSIAALIPHFDIAIGFVPDYMHAVLLGVERMLCDCWFGSGDRSKPYCISRAAEKTINEQLRNIRPPDSITRIPRDLKLLKFWKAKEFYAFLLYYSPILLRDKLPDRFFQHYILFVNGIRILLQSKIVRDEILLAQCMLNIFCFDVQTLYGLEKCSYNVHQLTHLAESVRLWGPLWAWSAFPFEDGNGGLMKIKHGPNKIDVELLNSLKLINIIYFLRHELSDNAINEDTIVKTSDQQSNLPTVEAMESLAQASRYSVDQLYSKEIRFYSKIKLGKQTLSSVTYKRQVKRDNTCVTWSRSGFFGVVQCYAELDEEYYAIVRQLVRCNNISLITHRSTGISLPQIVPVRDGGITHAIPICDLNGQLLRVFDYVCFFPNPHERK